MTRLLYFLVIVAVIAGLYMAGQTAISAGLAALLVVAWIFRQAIHSTRGNR